MTTPSDSDPTADLTDADVRAVCDEADIETMGRISTTFADGRTVNRMMLRAALGHTGDRWCGAVNAAVARLRAERAAKGTK